MDEQPGYWQHQYDNVRPAGAVLWCAAHRRFVRGIFATIIAMTVGLLVWAALSGGSLVSPILDVVTFSSQLFLWGFAFPRTVDGWEARQSAREDPPEP